MLACQSGVYFIRNIANGKTYVGSSVSIKKRCQHHKTNLRHGRHTNPKLQNAWKKYGEAGFEFGVLELVSCVSDLIAREDFFIQSLKPFYNCHLASQDGRCFPTPEAKAAMSARLKGRQFSAEHRFRISCGLKGRVVSAETRAKIGAFSKNRVHSAETRAKIGAASLGHKVSDEVKEKISSSNKGKKRSVETCAKIGRAHRGKKMSDETKTRMSQAKKGKAFSEDHKRNISNSLKGHRVSDETKEKIRIAHQKRTSNERGFFPGDQAVAQGH